MKADVLTMAISAEIVREEKTERKPIIRPNKCRQFLGRARGIFIFLFIASVWLFAFCNSSEMQSFFTSRLSNLSQMVRKETFTSNKIYQSAIKYEKELDEITR